MIEPLVTCHALRVTFSVGSRQWSVVNRQLIVEKSKVESWKPKS